MNRMGLAGVNRLHDGDLVGAGGDGVSDGVQDALALLAGRVGPVLEACLGRSRGRFDVVRAAGGDMAEVHSVDGRTVGERLA